MLPPEKDDEEKIKLDLCSFFSLYDGIISSRDIIVPKVNDSKYYSSRGWLIEVGTDLRVNLLHPFSRVELKLPPISNVEDWEDATEIHACIQKCALSSSCGPEETEVVFIMVIYGGTGKLAYARPGDQVWTRVLPWDCRCFDIIYYKDQFYGINTLGQIFAIDGHTNISHQVAHLPNGIIRRSFAEYLYLVESELDGALLVVSREGVQLRPIHKGSEEYTYGTTGFQVFEVDLSNNKWKEIKNLGNRCLFLGHNSSMSIDASNDPHCRRNCIYFTDDCAESYTVYDDEQPIKGGKDMGIYNIEDGSIVSLPRYKGNSFHPFNPPMWVERTI